MPLTRRPKKHKKVKKIFLIVCEGSGTEVKYFSFIKQQVRKRNVKIDISGVSKSKQELLSTALGKIKKGKNDIETVWIVFDKDDLKIEDIDRTFKLARENNIKVGFTNECFELWLLLHLQEIMYDRPIEKEELYRTLSKHLEVDRYEDYKNNSNIIERFIPFVDTAMKNNKKLYEMQNNAHINPFSSIFQLVTELVEIQ